MVKRKKQTYANAISLLNGKSLEHCLKVSCLFSCVEFFGGLECPLFPLLNFEKVRILAGAIVNSHSNWYKNRKIIGKELPSILNGVNSATNDGRLEKEVTSGGEHQFMLYGLQRYFSRMAYLQIRQQQSPIIPLGQLLAITEVLPNKCWQEFPTTLREPIKYFPKKVYAILGTTVSDLIVVHSIIIKYFKGLGQWVIKRLPIPKSNEIFEVNTQSKILIDFIDRLQDQINYFHFDPNNIKKIYNNTETDLIHIYAKIFSKSIKEHRILLSKPEYKIGPEGLRLSTLDRYPLIENKEQNTWYIPNIRCFVRNVPDVIHYTLNEKCRKEYQDIRGALLELYLIKLLKNRTSTLTIIPEERWMTSKGEVAGPDIIVIDYENPLVLGIEVKFRRMQPHTRFELFDEDMVNNYADLWKDIKKLPDKLEKVFSSYEKHQKELQMARNFPKFYLGIAGEVPFMFGELSFYLSETDYTFPLYKFPEHWAVMSTETFENFIEVVIQHQRSLAEVLNEYIEDCTTMEPSCTMAESFRSVKIDETKSFAASFLKGTPGIET